MSSISHITKSSSSVVIKKNPEVPESLEETKERLKKEINELKILSSNLEYGIGITKFGHDDNTKSLNECLKYLNKLENNVHDAEVNLQYILYNYTGLRCVKFTENRAVFKFATFGEIQKCGEYWVEIRIEDGKGKLGNWVMPTCLDMDEVLLETPIQYIKNMSYFLKNCKHHIFCYHHRMNEFNNLKSLVSEMKNCNISTNLNYTQINLELFGVHETESVAYLDLALYLVYHSREIQPYLIVIDSLGKRKFSETKNKALTSYFKYFKHMNLQESFEKLMDNSSAPYMWYPKTDSDSPLDLNDTSDTESEIHLKQYKRIRTSKTKKRLIASKNRKKQKTQNSVLDEIIIEDNPTLTLGNKRNKTEKIVGTPSSANKLLTSRNVKSKLKQTLLNFEVSKTKTQIAESDEIDIESAKKTSTSRSSISTEKQPILTSTPFRVKSKEPVSFRMSAKWNISKIKSNLTPTKNETILTRKKIQTGNMSKGSLKKKSSLKKDTAKALTDMGETTLIKSRIPILSKLPGQTKNLSRLPILRKGVLIDKAKNKNAQAGRIR